MAGGGAIYQRQYRDGQRGDLATRIASAGQIEAIDPQAARRGLSSLFAQISSCTPLAGSLNVRVEPRPRLPKTLVGKLDRKTLRFEVAGG